MNRQQQGGFRIGNVEVDPAERALRIDGRLVAVGGRAFDLLLVLLERAGGLVSKHELLDRVWGRTIVEDGNLHVHISALRKVLGAGAIGTVPGRGYRYTLPSSPSPSPSPVDDRPATLDAVAQVAQAGAPSPSPIPVAPLPLVGRADDLAALDTLLSRHRLVTVTGAGGIGKTRLAAALLWQRRDRHACTAVVELASMRDPGLIASAVGSALGVTIGGGNDGDPVPALIVALGGLDALLLLDNAEHLVDALAPLVHALIAKLPLLHVVVTSQAPLSVAHERVFRLGGLSLPTGTAQAGVTDALQHGAIALFDERLRAADRRLRVDDDNLSAVLDICRRLDGIPLAIELAAARCPLLGVRGVDERLDERFRLLRVDSRSAPSRQQTLGAAMAWSHGLLTAHQQSAFRQLGVFSGTFTLEMAMQVVRIDGVDHVGRIDLLSELLDRSMISADAADPPRYRLLETGRLFALAQLAATGEEPTLRLRHARAMRAHFDAAWALSWVLPENVFVDRHEPDLDNLRSALDVAMVHDRHAAIAMTGAATRLWRLLSLHPEAIRRCQDAVALIDDDTPPALTARLWEGLAQVGLSHALSRTAAENAATLYGRLGDARGRYLALSHLVFSLSGSGSDVARAACAEMLRIEDAAWPPSVRLFGRKAEANHALDAGRLDEATAVTRLRLELATLAGSSHEANAAWGNLADLALITGHVDEAVRLGRALLPRLGRRDGAVRAVFAGNLLHALLVQGDDGLARDTTVELVQVLRQLGHLFVLYVADAFAQLAAREGRWTAAAQLVGYADAAYAAQGQSREVNEARARAAAWTAIDAQLAPGARDAALAHGATLSPDAVCSLAMARPGSGVATRS